MFSECAYWAFRSLICILVTRDSKAHTTRVSDARRNFHWHLDLRPTISGARCIITHLLIDAGCNCHGQCVVSTALPRICCANIMSSSYIPENPGAYNFKNKHLNYFMPEKLIAICDAVRICRFSIGWRRLLTFRMI